MAKKRVYGYTIDAENNYIRIPDNIHKERLLLITDVDTGKIIYNFADTAFISTDVSYNDETEYTIITTSVDLSTEGVTDTSKLQIFIDKEETIFSPIEPLLDPVSKLRVSNPENLIDTDFEYGMQSTKWETLQTVNNIPTVYSTSGDTPVEGVTSVISIEGSKQVKVTTDTPHGMQIGNPISVQGVEDYQSEGYFVISGVADSLTFFFELDVESSTTGDISGSYTSIIAAKFFEGSPLNLYAETGATTNNSNPSTLSVTTNETHGFNTNTKVYLRNTVGPKTLSIANSAGTAPDGRPYLDLQSLFTTTALVDTSLSTGRGGFRNSPVITYDWESTYTLYLSASQIDVTNNQITWVGHEMRDKYTVLFNTPNKGDSDCGMTDGYVYYVKYIDDNTISLYNDEALSSLVNLTALVGTYGTPRLGLCYKIESANGYQRDTAFYDSLSFGAGFSSAYSSYYMNVYGGNGTSSASPIQAYSTNNGRHGVTGRVYWNLTTSGTVYYSVTVSSESRYDYARLYINNSNRVNISGSSTVTGSYYASAGNQIRFEYRKDGSVNRGSDRGYLNYMYGTGTGTVTEAMKKKSGADIYETTWGLGRSQPQFVSAFQGRTPGAYSSSADAFSYQTNLRTNGRYGQINIPNTTTASSHITNGLNLNSSDSNTSYGSSSQIFYVMCNYLNADRNTLYKASHGATDGQTVNISIADSEWNAGERFIFGNSSGSAVTMPQQFDTTVSVVNSDVFKIQTSLTPETDDIMEFPSQFTMNFQSQNPLYNTFYVTNHKITGTAEATYKVSGLNEPAPTVYNITAETGNANYLFTGSTIGSLKADPGLVVYRGLTYNFVVAAAGHPFYLTTNDGTGYVSGSYVGEYTTGVTNSRADAGTVAWTVDAGTPDTLYYQCGNHAGMFGTITVRDAGTAIGGLTNNTNYNLIRINDSRLSLQSASGSNTSATGVTAAVGAANNNTVSNLFVDLETPLGITPSAASITKVEFRGDFGFTREYVLMTFSDGDEYYIGERDGADTSAWLEDPYFSVKNVTDILTTQGGKKGITLTFNPTSQVNFAPFGMSNYWEIRLTVSADTGTIVLSGSGTGNQDFIVNSLVGAYDGVFNLTNGTDNKKFDLTTDFLIPERSYIFTNTAINATDDEITLSAPHNFITGEKVSYIAPASGHIADPSVLTELNVIVVNETTIKLAGSYVSAINNIPMSLTVQAGTHTLISTNVIKSIKGGGNVDTVLNSKIVTGNGTSFLTQFKRFDIIWITDSELTRSHVIDTITTDESMTLFTGVTVAAGTADYYYGTQIMLRPDGYSLHKSFDGGVDITAGTSPNSKIVRQSRKYFRYQSGKGIQNSFAINFNPAEIVNELIVSSGNTATVTTPKAHNLSIGEQVTIEKAEVTQGANLYNGTYSVSGVVDPFTFTYDMLSAPEQIKAGGYPTYVRKEWQDAYVRGGMFDDQNGFFFEFDGQQLHCVRRSSTLQIAGSVTVTRGSQVIVGNNASFTTQLNVGNNIVVRGQSYKIVEISSNNRLIVQPSYKGISAKNVKCTLTVDTKTPQSQWNIDPCDGTGPTGYIINVNKIQMAYCDYSWYGAGKIRYGFKDQHGHVEYVHEYIHNNKKNESYFRSGNLPGRYEIENGPNANASPTLFHFGTSIIMDGRFDNDKAYLFTGNSAPFAFTNGASSTFSSAAVNSFDLITLDGKRVFVYAIPVTEANANTVTVGQQIAGPSAQLPAGTYVAQVKVDGANSKIYTSYPATLTEPTSANYPDIASASTITVGETTAIPLDLPIPLISVRLAPSVDSSLTGAVGEREIINRMQLQITKAGITADRDVEIFLILNSLPSNLTFKNADSPSLSQIVKHNPGDTLQNGTTIYSLKASSGSVEIDVKELLEMGNSILGGDGIFPAGPDLLTLAVQPQSTAGINGSNTFFTTGKLSWSESQA